MSTTKAADPTHLYEWPPARTAFLRCVVDRTRLARPVAG
jgi:hypothetical protein